MTKTTYPADNGAVDARRSQPMKPVADRESAGDPEASFQRGKHGKRSKLGYEVFFSTDGKQLCIEEVLVAAEPSQGQPLFLEKLEQSEEGQTWSVDAEFRTGEILDKAEGKGVILNTPPRQVTSHGTFPKTEFVYDAETDTYTCPHGQLLSHRGTNHKNGERYDRPESGTCADCPLRDQCTTSKTGRTVTRNQYEASWERQREHARTPEAVMGKVLRGIIADSTNRNTNHREDIMLETILNNFAVRVKEKVAELTNELKQHDDFQHVEEVGPILWMRSRRTFFTPA